MCKGFIYRHWIVNDKGFEESYIGKTISSKVKSRWGKGGYGYIRDNADHKFARAINKYGWDNFNHEVIGIVEADTKEQLNKDLAEWEKYYIDKYDSYYDGYNSTLGGEGIVGFHLSEETKQKQSELKQGLYDGENNPMYGISPKERMDEETYNQWLENHKTATKKMWEDGVYSQRDMKGENNPMYGITHSEEAKQKMRENHYDCNGGKNPFSQKIVCVETKQVFDTVKEAGIWCGLKDGTSISHHLNGSRKSAGKHPITKEKLHWMYYKDYLKLNGTEEIDSVTDVA